MIKVGIAGSPSSGKTTLARALGSSFVEEPKINNIELILEYARRYIAKYGAPENVWEQIHILNKQLEWEEHIPDSVDLMITDCPIYLCWTYSLLLRKNNDKKEVMQINDLFSKLNKSNIPKRYDVIFYIPPIVKPIDDGIRCKEFLSPDWIEQFEKHLTGTFSNFPPKNIINVNEKDINKRVKICKDFILNMK